MIRPNWDEWGLALARTVALRADCSRRQVGAVLLSADHRVLGTGYNGAASGEVGCLAGGCPRAASDVAPGSSYDSGAGTCVALHAEQNALLGVARRDLVGSTLYVTDEPCAGCARTISGTPVERVVVARMSPEDFVLWMAGTIVDLEVLHIQLKEVLDTIVDLEALHVQLKEMLG